MIVLDTNVVSEFVRTRPDRQVLDWVDRFPEHQLWTTAMTAAELLTGITRLPPGRRKRALGVAVNEVLDRFFEGRILAFDAAAAVAYARVEATRRGDGRPISTADAVIAATCIAGGADLLATRNTTDFAGTGLQLIDPWQARTS